MTATLVQSKSGTGSSGTTLTITLNSATVAGNCLVVCIGTQQGTTNPTVSGVTLGGSAGNFAAAATAYNSSFDNAAIWVDPNCAGGQTSVVISFTGGSGTGVTYAAWVMEWSGISGSSPVDQSSDGNGAGTSFSSGATGTTVQAAELVVGVDANNTSTPTGPSSPWTNLTVLSVTSGVTTMKLIASYQVASATGTFTYSGSISGSGSWGAAVATLKAGSAGNSALLLKFP